MVREDDAKLLQEEGDVQLWRMIARPLPRKPRAEVASYVVQVIGQKTEAFRFPGVAWRRFTTLCAERSGCPRVRPRR